MNVAPEYKKLLSNYYVFIFLLIFTDLGGFGFFAGIGVTIPFWLCFYKKIKALDRRKKYILFSFSMLCLSFVYLFGTLLIRGIIKIYLGPIEFGSEVVQEQLHAIVPYSMMLVATIINYFVLFKVLNILSKS